MNRKHITEAKDTIDPQSVLYTHEYRVAAVRTIRERVSYFGLREALDFYQCDPVTWEQRLFVLLKGIQ